MRAEAVERTISRKSARRPLGAGVFKRCSCGRQYTPTQWDSLPTLGVSGGLVWKNCGCGSTMVVPLSHN